MNIHQFQVSPQGWDVDINAYLAQFSHKNLGVDKVAGLLPLDDQFEVQL